MNEDGKEVSRVGIVLISHDNHMIPHAYILPEPCSNNVAEYRAIIIGMQVAQAVGAKSLEVYGDSQLVVNKKPRGIRSSQTEPHSTPRSCEEIG
jgi:ribonuclease HI